MTCPDAARLRTHIDHADPEVDAHLGQCDACMRQLADLHATAQLAARSISTLDGDRTATVDVDTALRRAAPAATPTGVSTRYRLPTAIAAGVVAPAVVAALVITPTGRQAAADFLAMFRAEQVQVVTVDPEQPFGVFDVLEEVAEIDAPDGDQHTEVDSPADAGEIAGFTPSEVSQLPDGAVLDHLQAAPPSTVRMTFRADRAPELPPALDGAQLVVSVPGTVASIYAVDEQMLVIGEAGQLSVEAVGGDLEQIREYLLSRPEVPTDLARQLLEIDDWTTTLPIPVPVDDIVWRDTTVAGHPGLMLTDPMGAGLLWQSGGRLHVIGAEGLDIDALRRIADGLG
ncbi:hypothetical protein BH23ACT10_BH23ACT10_24480 [soil metagenome]